MKRLLVIALSLAFAATAGAQVVRCVDAAGKVSYGDTACSGDARRSELVLGPEATQRREEPENYRRQEQLDSVERASRSQRESVDTVTRQPAAPGGVVLLDSRANDRLDAQREEDRRRREAELAADEAWRQPGYGYGNRRSQTRPQDMRPRLTQCGPAGCNDTQGNHYDRSGQVDRYVRPDGRTCRPVGTTVVCN
jgi:hypothetical protein